MRWFTRLAATLTSWRPAFNLRPVRVASGGPSVTGTVSVRSLRVHPSQYRSNNPRDGTRSPAVKDRPESAKNKTLLNCTSLCAKSGRTSQTSPWCKSAVMWEPLGRSSAVLHLHITDITPFANAVFSEGCMLRGAAESWGCSFSAPSWCYECGDSCSL